jgi:hypothetical protein
MSDDRLISPPRSGGMGQGSLPAERSEAPPPALGGEHYYPAFEPEGEGLDWRRYLHAIIRYKWLVVAATMVGAGGAFVAWGAISVSYTAEGNLWIESQNQQGTGDVGPVRAAALLESASWIQLLRTYTVLDSVVTRERLYVRAPDEFSEAFATFALQEQFAPGDYELTIGPSGQDFTLVTAAGATVQQGPLGADIGAELGFAWRPPVGSLPAGSTIPFTVMTPRDAAAELSDQLGTTMDQRGNFLALSLNGTNPTRIANVLNAVMDRHVAVAADLKRARLEETRVILEDQLRSVEEELAAAERALEEFRVETISYPTDRPPIAAGLQATRDPVFTNFFEMRIELEQIRRDRVRLQTALTGSAAAPPSPRGVGRDPLSASGAERALRARLSAHPSRNGAGGAPRDP